MLSGTHPEVFLIPIRLTIKLIITNKISVAPREFFSAIWHQLWSGDLGLSLPLHVSYLCGPMGFSKNDSHMDTTERRSLSLVMPRGFVIITNILSTQTGRWARLDLKGRKV